jgi:hypothetical protein
MLQSMSSDEREIKIDNIINICSCLITKIMMLLRYLTFLSLAELILTHYVLR